MMARIQKKSINQRTSPGKRCRRTCPTPASGSAGAGQRRQSGEANKMLVTCWSNKMAKQNVVRATARPTRGRTAYPPFVFKNQPSIEEKLTLGENKMQPLRVPTSAKNKTLLSIGLRLLWVLPRATARAVPACTRPRPAVLQRPPPRAATVERVSLCFDAATLLYAVRLAARDGRGEERSGKLRWRRIGQQGCLGA